MMHGFFLAATGNPSARTTVHLIASDVYITRDASRLRTASSRTCKETESNQQIFIKDTEVP